jgi:hypothetical protein
LKKRTKKQTLRGTAAATPATTSSPSVRALSVVAGTTVRRFLRRYALTLLAGLVCLLICFWMITEGTGTIFIHRGFDAFYDGQAASLAQGHWDVSPDAILGEAFVFHGKYYGYFGFAPAIPRMLLNWIFPAEYGQWSRFLMLLWIALVIAAIIAFMDEFEVPSSPFLIVVAVLGSTLFFLCSHAIVYHEAIITGAALAIWAYYFFCRYLRQPQLVFLGIASLLSFLSFFSRVSSGSGPPIFAGFLCAALLVRRFSQGRGFGLAHYGETFLDWLEIPSPTAAARHAAFLAICIGFIVTTFLLVNHAKFGVWLDQAPWKYHVQYDAARLARIDGKLNHLENIPFGLSAYFGPGRIELGERFPWFGLTAKGPGPGSAAKLDLLDRYASIPAAMPGLAILSIFGVVSAVKSSRRRRTLAVLAAAFAAGCSILVVAATSYRYLHDFYPFLIMASILGVGAVQSISSKRLRRTAKTLIFVAGVWSIAANFAFALEWQREGFWPEPGPKAAFLRWRARVDSTLQFRKAQAIRYRIGDEVEFARTNQLLNVVDPSATYRYDGRRWTYVSGVPLHLFHLLIRFPRGRSQERMPLWFAGSFGASDAVYIVYLTPTRITFCYDYWGTGGSCGPEMDIEPDRQYRLEINADRLNSVLTVMLDDRKALEVTTQFHLWKAQDVLLGKSPAAAAHGAPFTGVIQPSGDDH